VIISSSTPIICRTRDRPESNVAFDDLRYLCICESLHPENIRVHVEAACTPLNEKVQLDETNLDKLDQTREVAKCSLPLLFGAATARAGFFLNANKCCGRVATAIAIFAFAAQAVWTTVLDATIVRQTLAATEAGALRQRLGAFQRGNVDLVRA